MNTKNNYTLSELLLDRKQMEVFLTAEVKKKTANICRSGVQHKPFPALYMWNFTLSTKHNFLFFVFSDYLHNDWALN